MPVASVVSMVLAALLLLPGTAAADVTVAASRAEAAARNVTITFRVTNADPAVATTRLAVFLPTVRPLLGVRPTAPRGWTARVTTAAPATPLTVDGAPVGDIATAVVWEGGTVAGSAYAVFPLDVDRLPDGAGPLRFHVVATTAGGATEEWSDLVTYGLPAPAHPALEIPYGGPQAQPVLPAAAHHHGDDVAGIPAGGGAVGGLVAVVALAGAAVASAVGALGRRQRRRLAVRSGVPEPDGERP